VITVHLLEHKHSSATAHTSVHTRQHAAQHA
jgi:hypothetical protein